MFPRDAITLTIDDPASGSTILAGTSTVRTVLFTSVACQTKSGDLHIMAGSKYIYDFENSDAFNVAIPMQNTVPVSTAITYTESSTNHCSVQLTYVDRDRSKTFDPQLSESSTTVTIGTTTISVGTSTMTTTDYAQISFIGVTQFLFAFVFAYWLVRRFI